MMRAVETRTFTLQAVKVVCLDAPFLPASKDGAQFFLRLPLKQLQSDFTLQILEYSGPKIVRFDGSSIRVVVKVRALN